MHRVYEAIAIFAVVFFAAFTVAGVFGMLPSDLQDAINPDPLRLFAASVPGAVEPSAAVAPSVSAASSTASVGSSASSAVRPAAAPSVAPSASPSAVPSGAAALGFAPSSVKSLPPIVYTPSGVQEYPTRIVISSVGIDAPVINPDSTDESVLDQDLLSGAVRYPLSGVLNGNQDIFIFGHSTGFKVVHNKAYQTFSGLMNVKAGDEVRLEGEESFSLYKVTSVSILKDSDAVVSIGGDGKTLTISTCDTFAAKEDRVVVTAAFIGNFKNGVVGYSNQ